MDKNSREKPGENESWLTVSDWITFLSSEKYGIMSNTLSFAVLLVALIGMILLTKAGTTTWQIIGNGIFVFSILAFAYVRVFRPFEKRGKLAEKILKDVISGTLISEASIRKAWEAGLIMGSKGSKRTGDD